MYDIFKSFDVVQNWGCLEPFVIYFFPANPYLDNISAFLLSSSSGDKCAPVLDPAVDVIDAAGGRVDLDDAADPGRSMDEVIL